MPKPLPSPTAAQDFTIEPLSIGSKKPLPLKFNYFRIVILCVSTVAMTFAMANPLVLNFTIICMMQSLPNETNGTGSTTTRSTVADSIPHRGHEPIESPGDQSELHKFHWTVNQKSTALSAFAWGATAAILPLCSLTQRFGARRVFFTATILSSLATIICPLAANSGIFALFIIARIVQGFGYAAALPMMAAMTSRWSAAKESAQFLALGTCCIQFSPIITMPIGGVACVSSYGWPLAFYWIGSLAIITTIIWALIYNDYPLRHNFVTEEEGLTIMKGKLEGHSDAKHGRNVPYRSIFRSLPVWAIIMATFGNMFGIQLIITYMPTYLRQVMNFEIKRIGFLSASPHIGLAVLKTIAGILSDKAKCHCGLSWINETFYVRLYNAIAFIGMALCYVGLTFMTSSDGFLALTLFTVGASILGFNVGSFFKSVTIVAQVYSGWVMGLVQLTTCSVILALPYIVGEMTKHGTSKEWMHVFALAATLLVVTNFVFCAFGSGEPADWARGNVNPKRTSGTSLVTIKNSTGLAVAPLSQTDTSVKFP